MLDRPLKRILAVDDDPDVLELATLALGRVGGYTVRTCGSGREAIDRCLSFQPDLILLDVMMPGVDGFGTLKALREIAATADTPVVFMTAMVQRQDIVHYEELGCLGVIPKPVDLVALPEMLEGMWGRRRVQLAEVHKKEFEALRQTYIRGLSERIGVMRAAAAVLVAEGWDRSAVESLYHQAHRMAGTSGLYQLSALSRSAGALEGIIKRLLNAETWPPPSPPLELTTLVKAVERTVRKEVRQVGRTRTNAQG